MLCLAILDKINKGMEKELKRIQDNKHTTKNRAL